MNTDNYDVIEMDFPPYSADSFKLPDIEPDESFNENKNEIYLRNIAIAKDEETRLAAAKRAERDTEKAEPERMYKSANPAVKRSRKKISIFDNVLFTYILGMIAVVIFSIILGNANLEMPSASASWQVDSARKQAIKVYIDCTAAAAKTDAETTQRNYTIEGKDSEIYLGSTKADISEYRSYNDGYVYGSFSEGYGVDYVLWSETPIPVKYRHRLTEKETERIARKEGLVIGCYPLLSKDEATENDSTAGLPLDEKYKEVFDIQYDIASIEPLKNYPEEYEESGGKELAVTFDFTYENIKNDKGSHSLKPKVMCLDLGGSNYIKPFCGSSDNFEGAYQSISMMFFVKADFSVTYFVDADELRAAQGIAYRLSEYEYEKSRYFDVPNFKIAFDYGEQRTIYEYLEKQKKEEELLAAAPDMLELLKTTAVREPFEDTDGGIVYNNKAVSVKIEPSSVSVYNGEGFYLPEESMAEAKITIKNLTNFGYKIRPNNFSIEFDKDYYNEIMISPSGYDEEFAEYDENGELLLGFDENNLCSFTVTASGNNAFSYCYLKYDMPPSKKMQQDIDGFKIKIFLDSQNTVVE